MQRDQAIAQLWARNNVAHKLHAVQRKIDESFSNSKHQIYAIECARQTGKTSWGVYLADKVARQYPRCQVRIAMPFFVDIKAVLIPAFQWLHQDCPPKYLPIYMSSTNEWHYQNGSIVRAVGLDRSPEKMRGSRIRLTIFEEAGFADSDVLKYVTQSIIIPAGTHEPDSRIIFISTTPIAGNDHYFCAVADQCAQIGAYSKFTIHDNPLLTKKQIKKLATSMGGEDSIAFRREYLCERVIDSSRAIIPEWTELEPTQAKEVARPVYFQFLHQYEALDSGVRDKTVVLFAYYDFPRATLVIEDEVILSGDIVTTRTIANRTLQTELKLGFNSLYRRISDNNNLILIQDLNSTKHKDLEDGVTSNEYVFKPGFTPTSKDSLEAMVNYMRLLFKDKRIEINPRCVFLLGTLRSGVWNRIRDDFARSTAYGHADAIAALMYLVRNIDVYTNPIPASFNVNQQEHWYLPDYRRKAPSDSALAFKSAFTKR